jgi:CheY-like chemotaxis protein
MIPKILLVDDVKLLIELEKNFLKLSPVKVLTASDGQEALEIVRREKPDLVYMDLNMPNMDGKSCCEAIKSDDELKSIPVIMVTTAGSKLDEQRCREVSEIDRRELRAPYTADVALLDNGVIEKAGATDISIGGLYVASEMNCELEDLMRITFTIPGKDLKIMAKGRVAWRNSGTSRRKPKLPSGFGIEFVEIDTDAVKQIRQYVDEQRSKG